MQSLSMRITPEAAVVVSKDVALADLGEEAVVLDTATGTYFGLNEVAARILVLAAEETTVAAIVDHLLGEFEVGRDRLERDVVAFVGDLERRGMLSVRDTGA